MDAGCNFFTLGDAERIVYAVTDTIAAAQAHLGKAATIVAAGTTAVDARLVAADLAERGIRRLLVEGGTAVNTLFLRAGLVDELRLAVAPFFVGSATAPRLVLPGDFPYNQHRRMDLASVAQLGDVVVIHYRLDAE